MSDENKNNLENEVKNTSNEFKEGWNQATAGGENKKLIAGILAIIIGAFGIHKFILGYNKEGIILLLITVLTCGFGSMITGIIGLVEGIIYLTKSDEEFYNTYQVGKKTWF
jgi:TM2 domain-containing membrane protein YozV